MAKDNIGSISSEAKDHPPGERPTGKMATQSGMPHKHEGNKMPHEHFMDKMSGSLCK